MEHQIVDIDKRLSIVETKIAEVPVKFVEVHTKIDCHQKKADDIGMRMYTVMEEIKDEITSFKLKKAEEEIGLSKQLTTLDNKMDKMNDKYQHIYKTVAVVMTIISSIVGGAYSIISLILK